MKWSINWIYSQIFKTWRVKRMALFSRIIEPTLTDHLLDVGGYPASWTSYPPMVGRIDALNVHKISWNQSLFPDHHINTLIGDGCALDFPDASYDIVFSNSVIEHVGSWENQQAFAKEARRVGKAVWVQTPAYECPLEPHYLAPFIHWLPKSMQRKMIRNFTLRGLLSRPQMNEVDNMVETIRLLTFKELKALFPDCEIYTERLFGIIPKSYIAIRKRARVSSGASHDH